MKNGKTADVLKAADGDIIFGSHQSRPHCNESGGKTLVRQNLKDYSTRTLTSSQSDMSASFGVVGHKQEKCRSVNSRSHSNSIQQNSRQADHDVNSTFIAGSLASAFVSSRKLSLSGGGGGGGDASTSNDVADKNDKLVKKRTAKLFDTSAVESR